MRYHKPGKQNRNSIQRLIIKAIAEKGSLAKENLAERVLFLFGMTSRKRKTNPKYDVPRGIRNLVDRGYIKIKNSNGQQILELTEKGQEIFLQITREKIEPSKPTRWDKKWRVVIYDIKESRSKMRTSLRDTLVYFGFIPVQKSVWVYPYPCEELLAMIKADFRVGKEVLYLVVDRLEDDKWLKDHFKL